MPQIALVSYKHNNDITIGMIPQLFQPPCHILISLMLANIVHQQRTHSAAVIGRSDGTVALLASGIPYLCLNGFGVDLDGAGCKFYAYCALGVEVEFIASETGEEVGLSDARVSDEDHCLREALLVVPFLEEFYVGAWYVPLKRNCHGKIS